jgi:N6-adenosine-specific RNA methylase IME4
MTPLGPFPEGPFRAVAADPPWTYHAFSTKGEGRSAQRHYPTMSLDAIKALPVADAAARDCHLFLWVTGPYLPKAFEVMEAWGFRYSAVAFTWVKLKRAGQPLLYSEGAFHVGMGHTTRKNAEFCLLGRRGRPTRKNRAVRELIIAPVREHSRKPDETYDRIQTYCDGPYLELFARTQRPGWRCWGDQTNHFEG